MLFAGEVGKALGADISRFIVSTHTMALASQLDKWLERGSPMSNDLRNELSAVEPVALPRRLMRHRDHPQIKYAKTLPALLESARDHADEACGRRLEKLIASALGQLEPITRCTW
jgi:CRISPR-associated protein Cmr2